ncbi:MAG: PAS domain-containing protein [Planctomycetota bacterium]|jgi:transcriptional regulator with PAS, ATPase and Fis domain
MEPTNRSRTYVNVFNCLQEPILLINKNYTVIEINDAAAAKFNRTKNQIVGEPCYKISHALDKPCWKIEDLSCPLKLAFEFGKRVSVIHKHVFDGKNVFEEVVATPLIDESEEIRIVVEELRDISKLLESKFIIESLQAEISLLRGRIPICASCKKIRNEEGDWQQIESYILNKADVSFTHAYCPQCLDAVDPEIQEGSGGY